MAITDYLKEENTKTELGDRRVSQPMSAKVVKLYHKDFPQKVGITIPMLDEENSEIRWADMVTPYMGKKHGYFCKPEINEQVLVAFLDGKMESPLILGSIARSDDSFMKQNSNEENTIKKFQFRNGSYLKVEEGKNEEGEEDKITIATAKDQHQMILDNAGKKIVIQDKEKNCMIELSTEQGNIKIKAEKKLTITVGDSIKVDMNGESGAVNIEAQKFQVKAGKGIHLESDGKAKLMGNQTAVEGSSSLVNQTSGMFTVDAPSSNFK